MQGATTTIKKFQFFDVEQDKLNELNNSEITNFENVSPNQMYAYNQIVFLSGKVKTIVDHSLRNENLILKVRNNQILDQYQIFNKMLQYFVFQSYNNKHYFITVGGDLDLVKGIFVNSIKIFEVAKLLDPNYKAQNKNIDNLLVKQIFLLRNVNNEQIITGKDFPNDVESISNIISFAVSKDFSHCALGLDRGQVIVIQVIIVIILLLCCFLMSLYHSYYILIFIIYLIINREPQILLTLQTKISKLNILLQLIRNYI